MTEMSHLKVELKAGEKGREMSTELKARRERMRE